MTDRSQAIGGGGLATREAGAGLVFAARALFLKHEWLRGYALMLPTLRSWSC